MFCFCCWFSVLWSKCQGCHHKYSYRYIAAFCLSLVLLCIDQMAYIRSKIETLCPAFNRLKAIPWQRLKNLKYIKTADPHNFNSTIFWYGKQRDQNWGNFSIHNFTTTYYTVWYWPKLLRTDEEASVIIGNQMNRCKTAMNFHKYVINFLERNIKLFLNFVKISFGCHIKFVLLRQWTINKTAIRISF